MTQIDHATSRAIPLRLWPGVLIVALLWLLRFGLPIVWADGTAFGVLAGMAGGLAVAIWWLFFSRAPWSERLGVAAVIVAVLLATPLVLDPSIASGAMGGLFFILAIPGVSLALVAWAAASRRLSSVASRGAALIAAMAIACGMWALVRTGGFTAGFDNDLHWRWTPTPEDRLVAASAPDLPPMATPSPANEAPSAGPSTPASTAVPSGAAESRTAPAAMHAASEEHAVEHAASFIPPPEWPAFRGSARNSVVTGTRIATDWTATPPVQIWRRPIGPGWSSFSVNGDLIYTQEQRGDDEVVAAYRLSTGEPVWQHRDAARFWESNGGAGPRGTPTLSSGRVYAFGATGILNVLDAATGVRVWSRNVGTDTKTPVPIWGFSSSPIVVGNLVVVAAAGTLAAYDAATGAPRWEGPRHEGEGYSSPHLVSINGQAQILLLNMAGTTSVDPTDGRVLWEHAWPLAGGPIVQPALTEDGDVLVTGMVGISGGAVRRLAVTRASTGWTTAERWTTTALKPYFNDYVVHKGHAYGFDGSILACISLADGARTWKGGRYGSGQLMLLPDQDLLLVVSEEGELALVSATPDGFKGLARVPGIEGKTWNHPVLVGDILLVRNGEEMAAFRLPTK